MESCTLQGSTGDANFITTIGETRVLPEDLKMTYSKLKGRF